MILTGSRKLDDAKHVGVSTDGGYSHRKSHVCSFLEPDSFAVVFERTPTDICAPIATKVDEEEPADTSCL